MISLYVIIGNFGNWTSGIISLVVANNGSYEIEYKFIPFKGIPTGEVNRLMIKFVSLALRNIENEHVDVFTNIDKNHWDKHAALSKQNNTINFYFNGGMLYGILSRSANRFASGQQGKRQNNQSKTVKFESIEEITKYFEDIFKSNQQ